MRIPIETNINDLEINVTPYEKPTSDVVARYELVFYFDGSPFITVRGGTVWAKHFPKKNTFGFLVKAPAYKSSFKYVTSFFINNKSLWGDISGQIINELLQKNGGKTAEDYVNKESEEVSPNEIPL